MGARLAPAACPALLAGLLTSLLASLVAGCGGSRHYSVVGTDLAPGVDGTLQVEQIEGGNSLVTLSLSGLPPAGRLGDDLESYVVWIAGGDGAPSRAGVLDVDEEVRTGRMMATTPLTQFTVTITAEPRADVSSPGPTVVVRREVSAE